MKTLHMALSKTHRIHLNKSGNYFIDIESFDSEGYINAAACYTAIETSDFNQALDFYEKTIELNTSLKQIY